MPSFSTSLSGLNASSTALSVIANNLANMNTVGYKSNRANFQDLFYQQIGNSGNGNAVQVGVGTTVGAIDSLFTQGGISSSGVPTDVAIQGDGFFVVNKGGLELFTRAGNLSLGAKGQLMTSDGALVQGYPAASGVINQNQTIGPLAIAAGLTNPPKATNNVQLTMNLDSGAAAPVSAASQQTGTGIAPATVLKTGSVLTFTDGTNNFSYTTVGGDTLSNVANAINANTNFTASISGNSLIITAKNNNAVTFSANTLTDAAASTQSEIFAASAIPVTAGAFSTPVAVNDALGATHMLTFNFTKTAANTWDYSITIPGADVGAANPVVLNQGTLTFNGSGQLTSPASNLTSIPITGLANGASNMTFNWNLYGANSGGLLTQVSGPSAASATQQDGYSSGTLVKYDIGSDGVIQGIFSNGQTVAIGQIALASFPNMEGMIRNGANEYLASLASGAPNIGAPGTGGRGSLAGGALEQSNVDIATEFAQLILAQRGYQANAKAITTFDQVTQEAINLKQG